jgi:hypothetical protein
MPDEVEIQRLLIFFFVVTVVEQPVGFLNLGQNLVVACKRVEGAIGQVGLGPEFEYQVSVLEELFVGFSPEMPVFLK